jgi:hypothetical protein
MEFFGKTSMSLVSFISSLLNCIPFLIIFTQSRGNVAFSGQISAVFQ